VFVTIDAALSMISTDVVAVVVIDNVISVDLVAVIVINDVASSMTSRDLETTVFVIIDATSSMTSIDLVAKLVLHHR
jgi:hypothetical protein